MASTPESPLTHVPAIARQTAAMLQTYRSWPASFWERPTFCPGWKAVDAIAHLATGGDFYAQVIAAGRRGTPSLPWGAADAAGFRTARGAAAQQLIAGGPTTLMAGFEQGAARLQAELESLRPDELGNMAWHPRGLVPIGGWIGMRLTELGMHDWDIRQPHETPAHLSATVLPALLQSLPGMQQQFLQQRNEELAGVFGVQAGEASWGFTVQGKNVTLHPTPPATCDSRLSADVESMILLSVGRADVEAKRSSGTLNIQGDQAKGQQLCAMLFRAV